MLLRLRLVLLLLALLSAPAAAAGREAPAFRLGDAATPLEYAVTLAIDPAEPRFSGEVRIALRFNRPTPVLWLNATGLAIESVEFLQGRRRIAVNVLPGGEDFVGFEAQGADFATGPAIATIRYRGELEGVSTRGLFRQQDRGDWYVVSQFEAIQARRAFPCFDEPGWKTPWQLTIDAPASQVVISNSDERRSAPTPGRSGWARHEFALTAPLPTYLVALAVGPFEVLEGGTAGKRQTRLRYFAPKGRASEARYAAQATPRLLEILEDYFGTPYPFQKLDTVAIPQTVGFGAMENVGMITYASSLLLATPREETPAFQRRYAGIAAHELSHMWFGNLVTLAWWDDIWLNESFASWMGQKALARFRPAWDNGLSVGWSRRAALELDRLASARRVRNPVREKTDLSNAFDAITYQKGSAVLAMFESWFSPERFRQGVRRFLKQRAYGTATSEDFIRALGEASDRGKDALAAFRGFIEQPGVPMLDVALRCTEGEPAIEVVQQRLRPAGSSVTDLQWSTPACFRYGSTTRCSDTRNGASSILLGEPSCPAWIFANAGGRSHYVPRYEASLAQRVRAAAPALSPSEMVSLVIDAGILSESGLMAIGEALAWADSALAHPSPIARLYAVDLVQMQREAWLTAAEAAAKREVIARRLLPAATELGWSERADDSDEIRELRKRLLPYAADMESDMKLRTQARGLAYAWLGDREAVDAGMTRPVLDTAARFADEALFGRLADAAGSLSDLREREYLLGALAKVRDDKLRSRALALALAPAVASRDAFHLIDSALEDEANRGAAFDFVRANFDALVAKLPQHSPAYLITPLAELCTPKERETFAEFFKERAGQFLGGALRYRQALERIDVCMAARGS
ncbi:MAG TPA: M1 family metallopeptidase [Burkholderiales bacterium]